MTLRIAPGLELPDDFVTQSAAIVARRGAGKTYLACVLAEELIKADLPVVVIDPLGAFWGLRSSADGKRDGLQVVILGGDHGDIALEPTAGKLVAEVIAEDPRPVILDLSAFESNAAQDRFAADFAERLYRAKAKSRTAMHLIVDEADSFAPQKPQPGQQRMLGAFEAIVRRGRIRGLGVTLITQRAAVLNKNVLTQAECLVTLQTTGPQDRKAIDDWIKGHGTDEERALLLDSLAGLQQGEAWFWSPAWLNIFQRIQVRRRETFDSSATPKAGALRVEPEHRAPLDLELLQKRMADTIERTKADDPRELRRQIAELDRALRDAQRATPEPVVERVEVPVLDETQARLVMGRVDDLLTRISNLVNGSAFGKMTEELRTLREAVGDRQDIPRARPASGGARARDVAARQPAQRPDPPARREPRRAAVSGTATLPGPQRKLLTVLATYGPRTKRQLAVTAGYSMGGGGFNNPLGALRSAGYVTKGELITITDDGLVALGDYDPLPSGPALLDHWLDQLPGPAAKILAAVAERWPGSWSKLELAAAAGYEPSGGGFNNPLGRLRTLGLVNKGPEIRLTDDFGDAIS